MVWTDKRNTSSIVAKKQNKKEPGQGHRGQITIKMTVLSSFLDNSKSY